MILAFAGLLALMFLFGCLGTGPTPPIPNQTNQTKIIPPTPSNISTNNNTSIVPTIPGSQNQTNATGSNQTNANETAQNQTSPSAPEPAPQEPEGILFAGGKYSLVLDDISIVPENDKPCGIFSIRDTNRARARNESTENVSGPDPVARPATEDPTDTILGKMVICKDQSRYWTDPNGNRYRILILDIAPGYTQESKWARAIIYG